VNHQLHIDPEALIEEIARYLNAVDLFRAEDCEPSWRPEHPPEVVRLERFLSDPREHRRVH
jgi:hypothetical protein